MRLRANIDHALGAGSGETGDSSDQHEPLHRAPAPRRHSQSDEPTPHQRSGFFSSTGTVTGDGVGGIGRRADAGVALSDSLSSREEEMEVEEMESARFQGGRQGSDTNPYAVSSLSLSLAPTPTSDVVIPPPPVAQRTAPTAASRPSPLPPRSRAAHVGGESSSSMDASDGEYNRIFERNTFSLEAPHPTLSFATHTRGLSNEFDVNLSVLSPSSDLNAQNTAL